MAVPNILSIRMEDENKGKGSTPIFFSVVGTATIATLIADAQAIVSAYDAVTGGRIRKVAVSLDIPLPSGIGVAPITDSFVQSSLGLSFAASGTTKPHTVQVPAVRAGLLDANENPVLTTGGDIDTLVNLLTGGSGVVLPTNDVGFDLTALDYAVHDFRKRKGEVIRSKVAG